MRSLRQRVEPATKVNMNVLVVGELKAPCGLPSSRVTSATTPVKTWMGTTSGMRRAFESFKTQSRSVNWLKFGARHGVMWLLGSEEEGER